MGRRDGRIDQATGTGRKSLLELNAIETRAEEKEESLGFSRIDICSRGSRWLGEMSTVFGHDVCSGSRRQIGHAVLAVACHRSKAIDALSCALMASGSENGFRMTRGQSDTAEE